MDKLFILKISGVLVVAFLLMLVAAFFLYPKLNSEKYEEVVTSFEKNQEDGQMLTQTLEDSLLTKEQDSVAVDSMARDSLLVDEENKGDLISDPGFQTSNEIYMQGVIDSLNLVINDLKTELDALKKAQLAAEKNEVEDFSVRVKSLLNLDEDELGPILEKMSSEQLVRLYFGGGTIQREKILRALNADKAAKLMTEIM